ncbi:hypothetical protein AAFC00_003582 [Neodothiora populina]|uniref:Shugoshin n=1 Tax=Neodothiora populina TaxID=2781224 RepID=A0ABR3PFV0_9PEZI
MARLNEAPLPTESVDVLRRRFIRQNRELAKINSNQSLRIRTLEAEVSKLQGENLGLREEIAHLQAGLSSAQSQISSDSLISVKDRLESKLRDLSDLVSELGILQPTRDASGGAGKRETNPESWRPEYPMAGLSGQCQRMSIVPEENMSPGGTWLPRLSNHSNESPDLGPPPIAHFDCEDPIKFDPQPPISAESSDNATDNDSLPPCLSVNLETRRRRKDTRRSSMLNPLDLEADDEKPSQKHGAKRKLVTVDAEEQLQNSARDDFVFSRRSSIGGDYLKKDQESQLQMTEPQKEPVEESTPILPPPKVERKVLGDKSVNMSPQKSNKAQDTADDLCKPGKGSREPGKAPKRERKPKIASVKPPQFSEPITQTIELPPPEPENVSTMPPKTPAPAIFSPTPSESSTARPEGRDTPPPSAFNPGSRSTSADVSASARPSRRARASVNYAEPNLISKMRRPDKNLADAVAFDAGRSISAVAESERKTGGRTVIIKQEEGGNSAWKAIPSSDNMDLHEPGSPLGEKGRRKQEADDDTASSAADQSVLDVAMASSADVQRVEETQQETNKVDEAARKMQEMALYDFSDSLADEAVAVETVTRKTSGRRHSTTLGPSSRDNARRRTSRVQMQLLNAEERRGPPDAVEIARGRLSERTRRRSIMG